MTRLAALLLVIAVLTSSGCGQVAGFFGDPPPQSFRRVGFTHSGDDIVILVYGCRGDSLRSIRAVDEEGGGDTVWAAVGEIPADGPVEITFGVTPEGMRQSVPLDGFVGELLFRFDPVDRFRTGREVNVEEILDLPRGRVLRFADDVVPRDEFEVDAEATC